MENSLSEHTDLDFEMQEKEHKAYLWLTELLSLLGIEAWKSLPRNTHTEFPCASLATGEHPSEAEF